MHRQPALAPESIASFLRQAAAVRMHPATVGQVVRLWTRHTTDAAVVAAALDLLERETSLSSLIDSYVVEVRSLLCAPPAVDLTAAEAVELPRQRAAMRDAVEPVD